MPFDSKFSSDHDFGAHPLALSPWSLRCFAE